MTKWSYSRISSFESCPKKYFYRYVSDPDPERVLGDNIAMVTGKSVHKTLEELYSKYMEGKEISWQELSSFFEFFWNDSIDKEVFVPSRTPPYWREKGLKCLANHFTGFSKKKAERTVSLEKRMNFKVMDKSFVGYVDRLSEPEPGHYRIHDYKTSSRLKKKDLEEDLQLGLYELGLRQEKGDLEKVELVWHLLASGRTVVLEKTDKELEELEKKVNRKIKEIQDTKSFRTRKSGKCRWCKFQQICSKSESGQSVLTSFNG